MCLPKIYMTAKHEEVKDGEGHAETKPRMAFVPLAARRRKRRSTRSDVRRSEVPPCPKGPPGTDKLLTFR